jgi:hypothetical protein
MLEIVFLPLFDWLATFVDPVLLRTGSTLLVLAIWSALLGLATEHPVWVEVCAIFLTALLACPFFSALIVDLVLVAGLGIITYRYWN